MHGPACIVWANRTPFSPQRWLGGVAGLTAAQLEHARTKLAEEEYDGEELVTTMCHDLLQCVTIYIFPTGRWSHFYAPKNKQGAYGYV